MLPTRLSSTLKSSGFSFRSVVAIILVSQMFLPAGAFAQMAGQPSNQMSDSSAGITQPQEVSSMKSGPVLAVGGDPSNATPLDPDQKILHILDRFTYGPRPGDVERLKAMGLSAWFNEQMNPVKIDDSALETRLADFPAMSMPLDQMMAAYPTRGMIRQIASGKISTAPAGEAEHAIYSDEIARYKAKKQADGKPDQPAMDADIAPMNPDQAQSILHLPADERFSQLCHMSLAQIRNLRQSLRGPDRDNLTAGFSPKQMEQFAAFQNPQGVVAEEAVETKILRDVYTERQLNEVMVDFWLNHFNVYMKKSQQAPYYIAAYERSAIRPRALGNFEDLLVATAMSPAMLNYLDNSSSVGPHSVFASRPAGKGAKQRPSGLNENYARELMELHTLGVGGGYSQKDVTEVAKVFTGWTVAPKRSALQMSNPRGAFGANQTAEEDSQAEFDLSKHEPGTKSVLGVAIKENNEKEGLEVLHLLATSPATAKFISKKLAVRFVSDDPPQALIDRMAATFLSTKGNIRQVLLSMINSPEFFTQGVYRAKVKTPQDFVVSALRASNAEVTSPAALVGVIADLGMPLYGMQTPNGYSMRADPWNNTGALVSRMNFALALSANKVAGAVTNWPALLGPDDASMTPAAKDAALEAKLLHINVSDRTRRTILAQISVDAAQQEASLQQVAVKGGKGGGVQLHPTKRADGPAVMSDNQAALAAGLLFGSPEFQRR